MKFKYILLLFISVFIISFGCDLGYKDNCGPFPKIEPEKFDIKNLSLSTNNYSLPIAFDNFIIDIYANIEYTSLLKRFNNLFEIFSTKKAFACSPTGPPPPISNQTILDISIVSDQRFNQTYDAGDKLNELFNIGHNGTVNSLNEFIATKPKALMSFNLTLKEKPESNFIHKFTVKYSHTNGENFELVSQPVKFFQNNENAKAADDVIWIVDHYAEQCDTNLYQFCIRVRKPEENLFHNESCDINGYSQYRKTWGFVSKVVVHKSKNSNCGQEWDIVDVLSREPIDLNTTFTMDIKTRDFDINNYGYGKRPIRLNEKLVECLDIKVCEDLVSFVKSNDVILPVTFRHGNPPGLSMILVDFQNKK